MTKKQEILNNIEYAKDAHIRWVTYAEAKYNGLDVSMEVVPENHIECELGKSISENGQLIYHLKASHSIAEDHEEFHRLYGTLNDFMDNRKKGNIFNKLMVEKKNMKIMENYAVTLKKLSDNIIKSLDNIINEVRQIPDHNIDSWFND